MSIKISFIAYICAEIFKLFYKRIVSSQNEFTRSDTALPLSREGKNECGGTAPEIGGLGVGGMYLAPIDTGSVALTRIGQPEGGELIQIPKA